MRELTSEEAKSVTGAVGPVGAVVGAVGGAAAYYGESIGSGEGSWGGLVTATAIGAIGGFVMGPSANLGAWSTITGTVGFYSGLLSGGITSIVDSFQH